MMINNVFELKKRLNLFGVDKNSYSIEKNLEDEKYCLEKIGEKWYFYYGERGLRTGQQIFDTEHDACEYMYSQLINDPTTYNT